MTITRGVVSEWPALSWMVTNVWNQPEDVGVPESTPALLNVKPGARLVAVIRLYVYGGVPPLAVKAAL